MSKDWIAVGMLRPDEQVPDTEKVFHDEDIRAETLDLDPPAVCVLAASSGA